MVARRAVATLLTVALARALPTARDTDGVPSVLASHTASSDDSPDELGELVPYGRMALSTNPARSASLYVNHFGGIVFGGGETQPSANAECADVEIVNVKLHQQHFGGHVMTFVRDKRKPNPTGEDMEAAITETQREMRRSTAADKAAAVATMEALREQHQATGVDEAAMAASWAALKHPKPLAWSLWFDSNDGLGLPVTEDWAAFKADVGLRGLYQCYGNILRIAVPDAMLTLEHNLNALQLQDAAKLGHMDRHAQGMCVSFGEGPDIARDSMVDHAMHKQGLELAEGWWKGVVGTSDPAAAAAFAVRYLGGELTASPYGNPHPPPGGHHATWVVFRSPSYSAVPWWLHFVRTEVAGAPTVTSGTPSPHALARALEDRARGRPALGADAFDTYLYNALRFDVRSLRPFLRRVRADGTAHVVRRTAPGAAGGSLFLPIPGSLHAIELRAPRGLESFAAHEYPRAWDVCAAR